MRLRARRDSSSVSFFDQSDSLIIRCPTSHIILHGNGDRHILARVSRKKVLEIRIILRELCLADETGESFSSSPFLLDSLQRFFATDSRLCKNFFRPIFMRTLHARGRFRSFICFSSVRKKAPPKDVILANGSRKIDRK